MTDRVQNLIAFFDRLSQDEQHEAAAEILRRSFDLDYPPLDEETLDRLADEVFQELDAREAAERSLSPG